MCHRHVVTWMWGVFIVCLCVSYCHAFDDGDFQYWNNESIAVKIDKVWGLRFEEELRFGDNAHRFYYEHSDCGISYFGFAPWLEVSLNYRHIYEEKNGHWREENRPHLDTVVKWKCFTCPLSNRVRLSYRNREKADDFFVLRNKFTLTSPYKFTPLDIQPYIADEIFFDCDVEKINRNELSGGMTFVVLKDVKMEMFYLWQSSEIRNKWNDTNVLGSKLKVSF